MNLYVNFLPSVSGRLKRFNFGSFAFNEVLLLVWSRLMKMTSWIFGCWGSFGAFGAIGSVAFSGLITFCPRYAAVLSIPPRRFGNASFIWIIIWEPGTYFHNIWWNCFQIHLFYKEVIKLEARRTRPQTRPRLCFSSLAWSGGQFPTNLSTFNLIDSLWNHLTWKQVHEI